jgi:hypothetical protein
MANGLLWLHSGKLANFAILRPVMASHDPK